MAVSVLAAGTLLAMASCTGGTSSSVEESSSSIHTHTASKEWKYDENNHWHLCEDCDEVLDEAPHTFVETTVDATDDTQGYILHTCECGYTFKDGYFNKKYAITFNGGDNAYAIGLPSTAWKGEAIVFKVTCESGYEAYDVVATYSYEETLDDGTSSAVTGIVDLQGSLEIGYTLIMPGYDVTISVETRGAYFKAGPEDSAAVVFEPKYQYGSKRYASNFIAGYLIDGKIQTGTDAYLRAGSKVNVLTNYVYNAQNVKYTMNGEELEEEIVEIVSGEGDDATTTKYSTVTFTMPASNADIEVTAEEKPFEIVVDAPSYVSYSLYTLDAEGSKTPATSAYGGVDTVYLDIEFDADHSNDNYKLNSVTANYRTRSGYIIKDESEYTASSSTTTTVAAGKTYSFAPNSYTAYADKITLTVAVSEAKYQTSPFVGTFGGTEFYGATIASNSSTITGNAFGEIVISSGWSPTKYYVVADEGTNKYPVGTTASAKTASTYLFAEDDIIVANYYGTRATDFSDIYVGIKGKSKSDLSITLTGNMGTAGYIVMSDKTTSAELGNCLVVNKTDVYLNVTIEFDDSSVTELGENCSFAVKKDGVQVAHYTSGTLDVE